MSYVGFGFLCHAVQHADELLFGGVVYHAHAFDDGDGGRCHVAHVGAAHVGLQQVAEHLYVVAARAVAFGNAGVNVVAAVEVVLQGYFRK